LPRSAHPQIVSSAGRRLGVWRMLFPHTSGHGRDCCARDQSSHETAHCVGRCDCEEMSSDGPRTNNGPCREKSRTQDKDTTSPTAARLSHWKIAWGLSIVPALILLLPKQHIGLSLPGCLLSAQRVSKGSPPAKATCTYLGISAAQSGCTFVVSSD
jgi:hypothetical protein